MAAGAVWAMVADVAKAPKMMVMGSGAVGSSVLAGAALGSATRDLAVAEALDQGWEAG